MTNPTIVVVPGAWQKPTFFENFCQKLRDAGYPTKQVVLPSVGGNDLPLAGLPEDVAAVQAVLARLAQQGKRVILLGHSSGGAVASNAAEGFDVDGIIYTTAFAVPKGVCMMDLMGGKPLHWMDVQVGVHRFDLACHEEKMLTSVRRVIECMESQSCCPKWPSTTWMPRPSRNGPRS